MKTRKTRNKTVNNNDKNEEMRQGYIRQSKLFRKPAHNACTLRRTRRVLLQRSHHPKRRDAAKLTITNSKKWVSRSNVKQYAEAFRERERKGNTREQTPWPKRLGIVHNEILQHREVEDGEAVDVKSVGPEAHSSHELLRLVKLSVAAKDGLDEFDTSVVAHGNGLFWARVLLGGLPHVILTYFEEHGEPNPKALATLEEVVNQLLVEVLADLVPGLDGPLYFGGQVDEEQPELAGHVGDGGARTIVIHGPVEDPLAKGVGIEDGSKEHDGFLFGVPVLVRVASGDTGALGILCRGSALRLLFLLGGRRLLALLGRGGGGLWASILGGSAGARGLGL
ncbi:hypothetical protein J1614_009381 [Plenodomus biglobosus]|nr:hypothetical protein J1614_009381 [Plenodomus biglobosus]